MDLMPILVMTLVLFGSIILIFLFGSFFVYRAKNNSNNRVNESDASINSLSIERVVSLETRNSQVRTIAIPETEMLYEPFREAELEEEDLTPAYVMPRQNINRFEVVNNQMDQRPKGRNNPSILFR